MKERMVTSVVLIAVLLLVGIINNMFLTNLVIVLITVAGMFEARNLLHGNDEKVFYFLMAMCVLAVVVNPLLIGVAGVLSVAGYVAFYQKSPDSVSLSFYPFLPMMLLEQMYVQFGMKSIVWLIVIIAFTDSFAYLIGKNFGKKFTEKNFSPASPNKTWEGVIGGVAAGSIAGAFAGIMFFDFFTSLIVSFFVSVASVFGDLFESYLKRRAGFKDSGHILPGHGGILDRIDGYLFGAPLMWALIMVLGNI